MPTMFSGNHGAQLYGLVCACLVMAPSSAMAQCCPSEPSNDVPQVERTLAVRAYNRSNDTWNNAAEVVPGKPPNIEFNQNRLCFFFRVKSNGSRTGALVIQVTRKFSIPIQENSNRVLLTRGSGFFRRDGSSKKPWKGKRTLNFYRKFHGEYRPDPDFREAFHGYWRSRDRSSSTSAPRSRMTAFMYSDYKTGRALRRTYLIRYSTSSNGSWIPFYIETAGKPHNLKEVHVRVWDIGSSTEEPIFTGCVVSR